MDRWSDEWSADWNGEGGALVDAILAARDSDAWSGARFESKLIWNLHGGSARYSKPEEARERLVISEPPRWVTLRLFVPTGEPADDSPLGIALGAVAPSSLEVNVSISETQVTVAAAGENPFLAKSAYDAARHVIETRAVTKVPYVIHEGAGPCQGSRQGPRVLGRPGGRRSGGAPVIHPVALGGPECLAGLGGSIKSAAVLRRRP